MGARKAKILFADDAPELSRRLAELLSDLPVEIVATAEDGSEALRLFAETEPDIAIIDMQMPKKSGLTVVSDVRKRGSKALVILLTNLDSPEFFTRAIRAGADHFLSKRTQFLQVRTIVEDYLRAGP